MRVSLKSLSEHFTTDRAWGLARGVKKLSSKIFLCFSVSLVAACSATGPEFVTVSATEQQAVIHIYRNGSVLGAANAWYLSADGERITTVTNGGYFTYFSNPGNVTFSAQLRPGFGTILLAFIVPEQELITIPAKAGGTYYVRFEIGPSMELVTEDEGKFEIEGKSRFDPL